MTRVGSPSRSSSARRSPGSRTIASWPPSSASARIVSLDVYPLSGWRRLEGSLLAKDRYDERYVRFRNVYVSGAHELPLDAQGRVLLPPLLREYAGIARDVMIVGDFDKFRIWDQQVWQRAFSEHENQVLKDLVPDDEPA